MTAAGGGVRRKRSEKGETGTMAAGEDYAVEETASNGKAEGYKDRVGSKRVQLQSSFYIELGYVNEQWLGLNYEPI